MGTSAGQIIEDADFTALKLAGGEKPIGRVLASTTQSLPHNTYTAVQMGIEEYDSHGFHSTSLLTSRVTPTIPGWYRFSGFVAYGGRTDYLFVESTIRQNGGTPIAPSTRDNPDDGGAATTVMNGASALVQCNGTTDYVEIVGRHNNTAALAQVTAQSVHLTSCLEWEYVRGL